MFKRVTIVALVVAAFLLMVAVPAMAFNGYRGDYTTTRGLRDLPQRHRRHPDSSIHDWVGRRSTRRTKKVRSAAKSLPYGSVCAGCHTSNYAPGKVTPCRRRRRPPASSPWAPLRRRPLRPSSRPATLPSRRTSSAAPRATTARTRAAGSRSTALTRTTPPTTSRSANGQCRHLRRLPFAVRLHGRSRSRSIRSRRRRPFATTLIQPQMAIGYPMLGSPASSPATGWIPPLRSARTSTSRHPAGRLRRTRRRPPAVSAGSRPTGTSMASIPSGSRRATTAAPLSIPSGPTRVTPTRSPT